MTILPENILRCMSPEDRAKLGKAGMTAQEASTKWQARDERRLQGYIVNLLQQKGIEVFSQRMDKRTRGKIGQPDFLFAIRGQAVAWEVKTDTGKLSEEQAILLQRLSCPPNSWRCSVIRNLDQAIQELRDFGL